MCSPPITISSSCLPTRSGSGQLLSSSLDIVSQSPGAGARCGECVRHNLRLLDHVLQLLEDGVRHEGCALGVSDHMLTDEASPRAPCLRMMVSFL